MTNVPGTYDWAFTYTFYPRHGQGTVTYTVHYADGHQSATAHSILVDPSGYVYNAITGKRIQGATVTLLRFDTVLQQFVVVSLGDAGIEPHVNPQITDENGGYGWMVSPGIYMVRVEKEGYEMNFAIVTVPPPATDLNILLTPIDITPPTTQIDKGQPHYIDPSGNTYVTSATSFTLTADDGPDGSGVAATCYRYYNVANPPPEWTDYSAPFNFTGLEDGKYSIDFYSIDNVGNAEIPKTQEVTLDNTPPTTTLTIGEPKYISDKTYVTPDTPFTLEATDIGSGVYTTAYRIYSATYYSGWQNYSAPFKLTSLTDGTYTIEYNSTDNVQNTETTHAINVTLFSWNYIYQDTYGRGTTLKINLAHKFFQFITPDKDYGIRKATYMKQCGRAIIIQHCDSELRLITVAVDTKLDFCFAMAWDMQTRKCYFLIDKVGIEK